jgi:ParB family chromosome partitioning protein
MSKDNIDISQKGKPLFVDIEKISPNPDQPRKNFNNIEIKRLADSIKAKGIIEPLVVRPGQEDGAYQLISGHRRLIAAKEAGLSEVPVIIFNMADNPENRLVIAMLENIVRAELNPIEEAEGYSKLEKENGEKIIEIANLFGKDRSSIVNSIRLLQLPEPIKDDIRCGRMKAGHGRAILSINELKDMMEARNLILTKALSVRATEKLAKRLNNKYKNKNDKYKSNKAFYESLEESFSDSFGGLKVSIKYNGQKKRIDIFYNTNDDILNIINKF